MENYQTIEQFFKVKRTLKEKQVIVSEEYKDESGKPIPWKIKELTTKQIREISKSTPINVKSDLIKYQDAIVVASVIVPNLKNADLQDSYGVMNARDLLLELLRPAEYAKLYKEIETLNGFKTETEMVKEVKNF